MKQIGRSEAHDAAALLMSYQCISSPRKVSQRGSHDAPVFPEVVASWSARVYEVPVTLQQVLAFEGWCVCVDCRELEKTFMSAGREESPLAERADILASSRAAGIGAYLVVTAQHVSHLPFRALRSTRLTLMSKRNQYCLQDSLRYAISLRGRHDACENRVKPCGRRLVASSQEVSSFFSQPLFPTSLRQISQTLKSLGRQLTVW